MQQNERITVEMIEKKEFKQKVRGYDPDEVDVFLDSICDEMVALLEEIDGLNKKINQLQQAQAATRPQPPAPVRPVEPVKQRNELLSDEDTETIKSILTNAKKVSDQTIRDAQERADAITEEARKEAELKLGSLEAEHDRLQEEIEALKAAAKDYRNRFKQLIEDQKFVIEDQKELFA